MTLPPSQDTTTQDFADHRLDLLKAWLQGHAARYALQLDTLAPASSDASFRRYFRLAGKAAQDVKAKRHVDPRGLNGSGL